MAQLLRVDLEPGTHDWSLIELLQYLEAEVQAPEGTMDPVFQLSQSFFSPLKHTLIAQMQGCSCNSRHKLYQQFGSWNQKDRVAHQALGYEDPIIGDFGHLNGTAMS